MRKIIPILFGVLMLCLVGCTQQQRARKFGGDVNIKLPKGQELMEATWKGDCLFYLTRPMSDGYVPVTKVFQESSSWGVMESTVYFIESR